MERLNLDRLKVIAAATTLAMFAGVANADHHLKAYGQVNRLLSHYDDGRNSGTSFADNAFAPSMLGVKGHVDLNKCVEVGAMLDAQYVSDSSLLTNQRQTTELQDKYVVVQHADTYMNFGRWGTVSLGQGDSATRGVMNMSYARTSETVSSSEVANLAGGMMLHQQGTGDVTMAFPTVAEAFSNLDGVYGIDKTGLYRTVARIKYQTAKWYGLNFAISSGKISSYVTTENLYNSIESAATDRPTTFHNRQYTDAALRYEQCFDDFMLGAAVGWAKFNRGGSLTEDTSTARLNNGSGVATRGYRLWSASVAAEHKGTGINAAVGYGNKRNRIVTNLNNKNWFVQLGKHFCWSDWGKSHVVVDYFKGKNTLANFDSSKSWSIGLVQDLDKAHSAVYATWRTYKYDRNAGGFAEFDKLNVASVGLLFKFGAML